MKISEVLCGARELLSDQDRWTRGAFARDSIDNPIAPVKSGAVRWCLVGACVRVTHAENGLLESRLILDNTFSIVSGLIPEEFTEDRDDDDACKIGSWNDHPDRTHEEVIEVLDKAIEIVRRGEFVEGEEQ